MTYEVEKNVKEWGDRLPAEMKSKLDASIERARKALRGDDMGEIRSAQEELSRTFSEAGQTFYAQSQAQPGAAPGGPEAGAAPGAGAQQGSGKKEDDVVEADYEIVDEGKK